MRLLNHTERHVQRLFEKTLALVCALTAGLQMHAAAMASDVDPDLSTHCQSSADRSLKELHKDFLEQRYAKVVSETRCNRSSTSVASAIDNLLLLALSQQYLGDFTAAGAAIGEIRASLISGTSPSDTNSILGFDAAIAILRDPPDSPAEALPLELVNSLYRHDDIKVIMAYHAYGTWLAVEGRFEEAYRVFRQGLASLESNDGRDTPGMVPILEGLADVYLYEQRVPGKSLAVLERLLNVVIDNPDDFSKRQQFYARLKLANHLLRFSLERRAQQLYQDAWNFADETEREQMTHQLDLISSQLRKHSEHDLRETVWFEYRFDLLEDGRPIAVELMDTNAPPIQVSHVRDLMLNTRFRPLFTEGRVNIARQQTLKVTFKAIPVPSPCPQG